MKNVKEVFNNKDKIPDARSFPFANMRPMLVCNGRFCAGRLLSLMSKLSLISVLGYLHVEVYGWRFCCASLDFIADWTLTDRRRQPLTIIIIVIAI